MLVCHYIKYVLLYVFVVGGVGWLGTRLREPKVTWAPAQECHLIYWWVVCTENPINYNNLMLFKQLKE